MGDSIAGLGEGIQIITADEFAEASVFEEETLSTLPRFFRVSYQLFAACLQPVCFVVIPCRID